MTKKTIGSALLLMSSLCLSVWLIVVLDQYKQTKQDLAELNDVKYGLLNAQVWVNQIADIVEKRINNFELTDQNRETVHQSVQLVLKRLIKEVDSRLREDRKKGSFFERMLGAGEQIIQDIFVDKNQLLKDAPLYTDKILDELQKPETKRELKVLIINYLKDFSTATFNPVEMDLYQHVIEKYQCTDEQQCRLILVKVSDQHSQIANLLALLVILINIILFGACVVSKTPLNKSQAVILILGSAILLIVGVLTPMIQVEAKISELVINLYGDQIKFTEQVLYYQSKSITDVVVLLFSSFKINLMFVACLIALFSICFPVAKLTASFLYFYDIKSLRQHKIVAFFALKSGKWSMADVMVIAIFMAYIGFDGMMASQLSNITRSTKNVDILTTNGTSIDIGFFMFLGFCLSSLLLSSLIEEKSVKQ